jgi:hypothetical protein
MEYRVGAGDAPGHVKEPGDQTVTHWQTHGAKSSLDFSNRQSNSNGTGVWGLYWIYRLRISLRLDWD